ncbi:unnamed protein product, partial [Meganyctiphanes norvegica]
MATNYSQKMSQLKEEMISVINEEVRFLYIEPGRIFRNDKEKEELLRALSIDKVLTKVFSKFLDIIVPMMENIHQECAEKHEIVMKSVKGVKDDINDPQIELDKYTQHSRRKNVRIHNILEPKLEPNEQKDDTNATIIKILHEAGLTDINNEDFSISHRIPSVDFKGKP